MNKWERKALEDAQSYGAFVERVARWNRRNSPRRKIEREILRARKKHAKATLIGKRIRDIRAHSRTGVIQDVRIKDGAIEYLIRYDEPGHEFGKWKEHPTFWVRRGYHDARYGNGAELCEAT